MRILMILVVGILSVGCGKKLTPKEEALRASVVGEYEFKNARDRVTFKYVFLENGIIEHYRNGKKGGEGKWAIVDGEIHVKLGLGGTFLSPNSRINVLRINPDKSITPIAKIYSFYSPSLTVRQR